MPRARVTLLRSSSTMPRKSRVKLPACTDTDRLCCKYPLKVFTERSIESNIDTAALTEKLKSKQSREIVSPLKDNLGIVSFDKQLGRKYEITNETASSLDQKEYYPSLYGKYRRSPEYNFEKSSERKEMTKEVLPDYS